MPGLALPLLTGDPVCALLCHVPPETLLPVLLGLPPDAVALVAEAPDGRLIGLANVVLQDDETGEVALLVEDPGRVVASEPSWYVGSSRWRAGTVCKR